MIDAPFAMTPTHLGGALPLSPPAFQSATAVRMID
jgi:hypothetical protein